MSYVKDLYVNILQFDVQHEEIALFPQVMRNISGMIEAIFVNF